MIRTTALAALSTMIFFGCASTAVSDDDDTAGADAAPGTPDADPFRPDAAAPPSNAAVFAHSATELYRINPNDLSINLVGTFTFDQNDANITDIAIDKDGNMVGISVQQLYAIDLETAAATYIADLDNAFNGLTYLPTDGQETLVGVAFDGSVYRIDPITGASTLVGDYGGDLESSGDLVAVKNFGIVATVEVPEGGNDRLARLDPLTFEATIIGDTGFSRLFGIGFWEDKVYGFSENRHFVLIDVNTGNGQQVEFGDVEWWGAGVTTLAPVIE